MCGVFKLQNKTTPLSLITTTLNFVNEEVSIDRVYIILYYNI